MAGLITRECIDKVREVADLKAEVEKHVTLKSAGIDSFKGLCPFHDERTPSFHVRPSNNRYHCFGCGVSGDVFKFIMEIEHTTFVQTVEGLAAKYGVELTYEDGKGPDREEVGMRVRALEANKVADEFFQQALTTPQARLGQEFLQDRGFTPEHAKHFGIGYAPDGWNHLRDHLRSKGFTDEELSAAGLVSEGKRGYYDRFRGRLIWPIRNMTGATIGFGARKLSDEDQGPKYLNTPETLLYKKSQVLYGIDLAKRDISKQRQLVVVEGYTDVMAAHLAGITTAVATCGTAFGENHVKIVRRLISDDGTGGDLIFTFDGDEAGQKAALRAFEEIETMQARTSVAIAPDGMDPCDLRQYRGDQAIHDLIASRKPLVEFVLKSQLKEHNLNTIEGRTNALRAAAPIAAGIEDPLMRSGYVRELASWLGTEVDVVDRAVREAPRHTGRSRGERGGQQASRPQLDTSDPVQRLERQALEVVLQHPGLLSAEQWTRFYQVEFRAPALATIHAAIITAGSSGASMTGWVESVLSEAPPMLEPLIAELAVTPLPANDEQGIIRYCQDVMKSLFILQLTNRKSELSRRLDLLDANESPEEFHRIGQELVELENQRRKLRDSLYSG